MKKIKLIIVLSLMCITGIYAQQNFSGYWMRITDTSQFNIDVTQIGDSIKGGICAVIHNGDFIDCYMNEITDEDILDGMSPYSIKGTVSGNIAIVDFFSSYAWGWGKATITKISDTQIKWEITVEPSEGTCFIPSESVLTNQTEE